MVPLAHNAEPYVRDLVEDSRKQNDTNFKSMIEISQLVKTAKICQ